MVTDLRKNRRPEICELLKAVEKREGPPLFLNSVHPEMAIFHNIGVRLRL